MEKLEVRLDSYDLSRNDLLTLMHIIFLDLYPVEEFDLYHFSFFRYILGKFLMRIW